MNDSKFEGAPRVDLTANVERLLKQKKSQQKIAVTITAGEGVEIAVIDSALGRVGFGIGQWKGDLLAGTYTIKYIAAGSASQADVFVDAKNRDFVAPRSVWRSVLPWLCSDDLGLERLLAKLKKNEHLVVLAPKAKRTSDEPQVRTAEFEGARLRIITFGPCIVYAYAELETAFCLLDVAGAKERRELIAPVMGGRRTFVFLGGVSAPSDSFVSTQIDQTVIVSADERDHSKTVERRAELAELVLRAIGNKGRALAPESFFELLEGKLADPCLGAYTLAYLKGRGAFGIGDYRQSEISRHDALHYASNVIRKFGYRYAAAIGDFAAFAHWLADTAGMKNLPAGVGEALQAPPMMRLAWQAALEVSVKRTAFFALPLLRHLTNRVRPDDPWLTWRALPKRRERSKSKSLGSAVIENYHRIESAGESPFPRRRAESLSVALEEVQQALKIAELHLPQSDRHEIKRFVRTAAEATDLVSENDARVLTAVMPLSVNEGAIVNRITQQVLSQDDALSMLAVRLDAPAAAIPNVISAAARRLANRARA